MISVFSTLMYKQKMYKTRKSNKHSFILQFGLIPCSTPSNILPFYVTAETGCGECPSFAALSTLLTKVSLSFKITGTARVCQLGISCLSVV